LNRGKRNFPLNLTDEREVDIVRRLLPGIDIVTINYRIDVGERLVIDYKR
jgi:crotonobetainyl-CoA:carnitine CoA-transferase CaiB-like acyl-CoA transferase